MDIRSFCKELGIDESGIEVEQFYSMVTGELVTWVYLPNGEIIRLVDDCEDEINYLQFGIVA